MTHVSLFKIPDSERGFTLVEVLVSLFILSIAITSITALITSNDQTAVSIRNNYIASGLVQEGVEIVRNLRDSDSLASRSFGMSLNDGTFIAQWNPAGLSPINPDSELFLNINSSNGLYAYNVGTPTIFKRLITITTPRADIEKKIVVTVSWQERNRSLSVSAESHLFNWPSP